MTRAATRPLRHIDFELRGEFIPLDALLKATGIAPSGGVAKMMVGAGDVQVDGCEELRKTCKIRAGQVVEALGARIRVQGPSTSPTTSATTSATASSLSGAVPPAEA